MLPLSRRGVLALALAALGARASAAARAHQRSAALGTATEARARTLPALDHEPELGVLLARAPRVSLELAAPLRLTARGASAQVGPGTLTLEALGAGWRIADGGPSGGALATGVLQVQPGRLHSAGRALVALDALPEFGAPRRMQVSGDLVVQPAAGQVELIERVGLEDYLASVVGAEMNPKWPAQALAAQAIVARSYAAARWMERHEQPWQLHWHFGVDMAYHGWSESNATVARAIAPTRGELLMYSGWPVLALFHASSGGRTEAFERVKPGALAPDGRTPIAPAMPVVEDDAALAGAAGLGLSASHGRWKTDVPLPELTRALAAWSQETQQRPRFGSVEGLSVEERHADSGRVARLSIRHQLAGATRFTQLSGADFRKAAGPVRIRSLAWDRCVIASRAPGYLVLEGRGFGHGCGLSQVSAWYLAKRGATPEAIVARFYAGARIERRY